MGAVYEFVRSLVATKGHHSKGTTERKNAVKWLTVTFFAALLAAFVSAVLSFPLARLMETGVQEETFSRIGRYFQEIATEPNVFFTVYKQWFVSWWAHEGAMPGYMLLPFAPLLVFVLGMGIGIFSNPYEFRLMPFGEARPAETRDLKLMGIFNGRYYVLGSWKGRLLRLDELLSSLCIGFPGTGKTTGMVIPSILETRDVSMIINDPKRELFQATAGHRHQQGPVFEFNWARPDDPEKGWRYPCWNPLSPRILPRAGPKRDLYIDSMVTVLVEDPVSGSDPHWARTGRNALSGMIQFIISKCERARANDYFLTRLFEGSFSEEDARVLQTYYDGMDAPGVDAARIFLETGAVSLETYLPVGTWRGLPDEWVDCEPCLSMILEWLNTAFMSVQEEARAKRDAGQTSFQSTDPTREIFNHALMEARYYGYTRRAITEINQMIYTPSKERASILSMTISGISIFKNEAVRERTRTTDITFRDVRGMKNPETGEMEPVSIYLTANHSDARAIAPLTGIFIELLSGYLISNPPDTYDARDRTGPFPALFVLDEMASLPKLASICDGPAMGRGPKVGYLMVCHDFSQISGKYGLDDLETIISSTAAKVCTTIGSEITADRLNKNVGHQTLHHYSKSRMEGFSQEVNPFGETVTKQSFGFNATYGDFQRLPFGRSFILLQNNAQRPIFGQVPFYYDDPVLREKTEKPPPPAVPAWILEARKSRDKENLILKAHKELEDLRRASDYETAVARQAEDGE